MDCGAIGAPEVRENGEWLAGSKECNTKCARREMRLCCILWSAQQSLVRRVLRVAGKNLAIDCCSSQPVGYPKKKRSAGVRRGRRPSRSAPCGAPTIFSRCARILTDHFPDEPSSRWRPPRTCTIPFQLLHSRLVRRGSEAFAVMGASSHEMPQPSTAS